MTSVAILEANNFHEETVFAFICAAGLLPKPAQITVFAPDHWHSRAFVRDDLQADCEWCPTARLRSFAPHREPARASSS